MSFYSSFHFFHFCRHCLPSAHPPAPSSMLFKSYLFFKAQLRSHPLTKTSLSFRPHDQALLRAQKMLNVGTVRGLSGYCVHWLVMWFISLLWSSPLSVGPISRFLFLAWFLAHSAWHNDEMKTRPRSLAADLDQVFGSFPVHVVVLSI